MSFPNDFVWGAATSSLQSEGAAFEDGKGVSIWDAFCRQPGAIINGDTAFVSCDHYHRYNEDIALMKRIGIKAYRFSLSWARIIPEGTGQLNTKGLDFYDRLINELLNADITPYVTLFHWDYPYELYKRGGWLNPDCSEWFADYAKAVTIHFSDRVKHWFTMNEPTIFTIWGYQTGNHAPGLRLGISELLQIAHNVLLANGKAITNIRENSSQPCSIGEALVGNTFIPETENDDDIDAAKNAMFVGDGESLFTNSVWMDPLFFGRYPEWISKLHEMHNIKIRPEDMAIINQSVDFLGLNIYSSEKVRMNKAGKPEIVKRPPGYPKMALECWPVTPKSLYWGPKLFYERYKKPIIITENGLSSCDWVSLDGKVHDYQRIDFMNNYLREYKRAIDEGVKAWGYFYWSIIDDFEWAWGFTERFGLIHVDFETQQRVIKDSGYWYSKIIESNGNCVFQF